MHTGTTIRFLLVLSGCFCILKGGAEIPRTNWLTPAHSVSLYYLNEVIQSDSAMRYARLAESASLGRPEQRAFALLLMAEVHGRLLGDAGKLMQYCREALCLVQDLDEKELSSYAHRLLGYAFVLQSRPEDAMRQLDTALLFAQQANAIDLMGWAYWGKGFNKALSGYHWEAFLYLDQGYHIGREQQDTLLMALSLAFLGRIFNHSGDPQTAIHYYQQFVDLPAPPVVLLFPHLEDFGRAYLQLGQFDTAIYYMQQQKQMITALTHDPKVQAMATARLDPFFMQRISLGREEYDTVIVALESNLQLMQSAVHTQYVMRLLEILAQAAAGKGDRIRTLKYAKQLYTLSEQTKNVTFRNIASLLLSSVYENDGMMDSALHYYRMHVLTRDSMDASELSLRAALYTFSRDAEHTIHTLQQKNIAQERSRNILAIGAILLLLTGIVLYRNILLRRRNEKLMFAQQQAAYDNRVLELEMQTLRAQMNPHFIFNCLSAIDNLVQKGESDKATVYLSRFARLIRIVLESSRKNLVSFHQDMEAMRLYLEMEQFRSNYMFDYFIDVDNELHQGDYKVPPLIIQPFIENAIHHGLLNKPGNDRVLTIAARIDSDAIIYQITDNGIGLSMAERIRETNKPGYQSYGIAITRERLQLHNGSTFAQDVDIIDLGTDESYTGTRAIVRIALDH